MKRASNRKTGPASFKRAKLTRSTAIARLPLQPPTVYRSRLPIYPEVKTLTTNVGTFSVDGTGANILTFGGIAAGTLPYNRDGKAITQLYNEFRTTLRRGAGIQHGNIRVVTGVWKSVGGPTANDLWTDTTRPFTSSINAVQSKNFVILGDEYISMNEPNTTTTSTSVFNQASFAMKRIYRYKALQEYGTTGAADWVNYGFFQAWVSDSISVNAVDVVLPAFTTYFVDT